jgi:O-antigen ligase
MSKVLFPLIIVGILFIGAALVWPTLGLLGYISINVVKGPLRIYIPWLFGFWGYLLDMGLLCIAILGVLRTYRQERRPGEIFIPYGVWICLIFLALWAWLRLPASRDQNIGMIKVLVFSIFDMATLILGFLFGRTQTGLRRMARAFVLTGIISVIGVLFFGRPEQEWEGARTTFGYATALAPADMAAYLVIVLTGFWLAKRTFTSATAALAGTIFVTGTIFLTGTRGPFLMLAGAILMMVFLYLRQINLRAVIIVILFLGVAIFAFRYYMSASSGGIAWRFSMEEIQSSIMMRVALVKVTLKGWATSPILGTGPGDFSVQMEGLNLFRYPHNLILEVGNELGLVGLIPFFVLFYYGFRSIKLFSRPELDHSTFKMYAAIVFGVFIYHFIGTFKGGGYAGSNIFYLSWGAVISATILGSCEYMQLPEYYGANDNTMSGSELVWQGGVQEETAL